MNDETKDLTKEKLIKTVVQIIGKEGVHAITSRRVAKESGVNVASINYYFRSKENLINEAIEYFFKNKIVKAFGFLKDSNDEPKEKIYKFFINYFEIIANNPGFPKVLIKEMISGNNESVIKLFSLIEEIQIVIRLIKDLTNINDPEIIKMKMMQLISPIIFPMAMSDIYPKILSLELNNEDIRKKYVKLLLNSILNIDFSNF